jgi:hypothetical protein
MNINDEVTAAVESFVRAADERNVAGLKLILHENFQNIQDGLFEQKGIFVITKAEYIGLIEAKKFGGAPRAIEFVNIDMLGSLAFCKMILESEFLKFTSVIMCVATGQGWQVILNAPQVRLK